MKIYCNLPEAVKAAIKENIAGAEFAATPQLADIALPPLTTPARLGEIIDQIYSLQSSAFKINGLNINLNAKTISNGKTHLAITEKEAAILKYLATAKNPVTREDLLGDVWSYAGDADTKTVETHIYRLRNKISESFGVELIISENGAYYIVK